LLHVRGNGNGFPQARVHQSRFDSWAVDKEAVGDETARATGRHGRGSRRALRQRRICLHLQNRMEHGGSRSALSIVIEAAARQQQEYQDRSGPSHLVD
jgi:hypothetical protein